LPLDGQLRGPLPKRVEPDERNRWSQARNRAQRFQKAIRMTLKLYMAQRLSALIMAPLVLMHIAVMIYAIQGGLSAAEILGRTQGSILWFAFYATFVFAVAVHAAIGLRTVLSEWAGIKAMLYGLLFCFTVSRVLHWDCSCPCTSGSCLTH